MTVPAGNPETEADEIWRPGRLWSLWDIMQSFYLTHFLRLMSGLSDMMENDASKNIQEAGRKKLKSNFDTYPEYLAEIGLSASAKTCRKIAVKLERDDCKWGEVQKFFKELQGRLIDETEDKIYFVMDPHDSFFYTNPRRGWDASISRFPSIVDDVEEASKCFALSRYAAAVFHSVQIVETGLIELGIFLKVSDPKSGWTAVSNALNKIVKKKRSEISRFEKQNFAFLEQVYGTVEGLKNAWRNKISHSHGRLILMTSDFSPEVAEEILFASRAFIRRVAEGLPPPKLGRVDRALGRQNILEHQLKQVA